MRIYANGHVVVAPCVYGWSVSVTDEAGRAVVRDVYQSESEAIAHAVAVARDIAAVAA